MVLLRIPVLGLREDGFCHLCRLVYHMGLKQGVRIITLIENKQEKFCHLQWRTLRGLRMEKNRILALEN